MVLAYRGTGFSGWQIQPRCRTVQGVLNSALSKVVGERVRCTGASRTDSGVHARAQHASFRIRNSLPLDALMRAVNHRLPGDLRVLDIGLQDPNFSARHHACAKHYAYFIFNQRLSNVLTWDLGWRVGPALDHQAMDRAAQMVVGTHCFQAFRAAGDKRLESVTTMLQAGVSRVGNLVCFEIIGRRFLYHMVRNIVGSLVQVGLGEWSENGFLSRFQARQRTQMAVKAPAQGLHLMQVYYPGDALVAGERAQAYRQWLAHSLSLENQWSAVKQLTALSPEP